MKVSLKQSVPKLGERDTIVDVRDGYARNFLLPKHLAEVATEEIVEAAQERLTRRKKEQEARRVRMRAMLSKIDGAKVTVSGSGDKEGTLYAAVSKEMVASALQHGGFEVGADDVDIQHPLKRVGEHDVRLDFGEGMRANVTVVVESD